MNFMAILVALRGGFDEGAEVSRLPTELCWPQDISRGLQAKTQIVVMPPHTASAAHDVWNPGPSWRKSSTSRSASWVLEKQSLKISGQFSQHPSCH